MLTSDHPWDPTSINDELEGMVIFPNNDEANNELYYYIHVINAAKLHLDHD